MATLSRDSGSAVGRCWYTNVRHISFGERAHGPEWVPSAMGALFCTLVRGSVKRCSRRPEPGKFGGRQVTLQLRGPHVSTRYRGSMSLLVLMQITVALGHLVAVCSRFTILRQICFASTNLLHD